MKGTVVFRQMDIVEELRKDRENGAKRLEAEYKIGLMALARRFCHDPGDAEELVNATFAEVIDNIDDYFEQSAFFAWMCQILTSKFSRSVRRKSCQMEVFPGEVPEMADESAKDAIYGNLDASLLRDAIGQLPPEQREVIVLRYFTDMPVAKIAKFLAIPSGTVRSRLHYARLALAAKLGVAAKTPGAKALIVALAVCGVVAFGAAIYNIAISGGAQENPAISGGAQNTNAVAGEARNTGGEDSVAAPSGNVPALSTITQQKETTMKSTTLLSAAVGATLVTGATPLSADAFIISGDPEYDPPAARAVSSATALVALPGHDASAADALEARNRTVGISGTTFLNTTEYTGFMLILK